MPERAEREAFDTPAGGTWHRGRCGNARAADSGASAGADVRGIVGTDRPIGEEHADLEAVLDLTGGSGADVVITATASGAAQEDALGMTARSGRVSPFGGLSRTAPTITFRSNLGTTAN